ncbi:MAG TPA: universal stress protein [Anaerolineae bacterium]|nr:universal stress protein [Anaerolineae bacterium]
MHILVCTIGSKQRETTLHFSLAVMRALAGRITLLGVVSKERNAAELFTFLNEAAAELVTEGLEVHVQVETGDAESLVMAELEAGEYDLVALGALGGKRSRRMFLDSVAMRIVERARVSVLCVKGNRTELSKVLICASGTEMGHLSVWAGAALACGAGASTTVLHVVDALPTMYTGLEQMEETLAELLQSDTQTASELRWAAQVVKAECEVSEVKLRRGIVVDEILHEAQRGDYDLIVIGSSEVGGGLRLALMGNLAREVMVRADRPVLVVRPIK